MTRRELCAEILACVWLLVLTLGMIVLGYYAGTRTVPDATRREAWLRERWETCHAALRRADERCALECARADCEARAAAREHGVEVRP